MTVVRTEGLVRAFGSTRALDHLDMHVPEGCVYGLVGPNGAGKSTLLSILAGLRRPTSGTVVLGVDRRQVAMLPDAPRFEPWLTARELVDHARVLVDATIPRDRVDDALERAGIADAADRRVGGFSRGMTQRLGIATCIVASPRLLLLDEPTSALDPAGRRDVLELVRELAGDATVILSSHVLVDIARTCDIVGVLHHGRMRFEGEPEQLAASGGSEWTIHLHDEAPASLLDALSDAPWSDDVRVVGHGLVRVHATDLDAAQLGLVAILADARVRVRAIEQTSTEFEQAFLELTR
ncbi:MAG: ABC transporter ATP-binding protein [Thermoleophilia bacterium]|nr:ABC transporter ATP-binding protein [Thermoleophilia bacterium]